MICQFAFENFKAFKNEAVLDFLAERISEHEHSLIVDEDSKEKTVPVIAIYGPNGGGKSTVLEALNFLKDTILRVIVVTKLHDDEDKYESVIRQLSSITPKETYYKLSPECKETPTKFDIMFYTKGRKFRYQLSLLKNNIVEENLYLQKAGTSDVSLIFERSEDECILGEGIEDIAVEKVNDSMPLLSHIAINYDIETIDTVVEWFFSIEMLNYDNPRNEKKILLPKTAGKRKRIFEMLEEMDIAIKDIRIEKDLDGNIENVYAKHMMENGEICELRLEEESSGTRKLLSCLARVSHCLEEGNLLIADELDAKLHPKLLRYLIGLFTNPQSNKKGAQLLLTSHDITTMNHDVFRRDEIWFCAKNPFGASKLYSLASFRKNDGTMIRNDEAYGKRYIEGRYGADPYIQRIMNWEDSE